MSLPLFNLKKSKEGTENNEKDLSTQQYKTGPYTRFQGQNAFCRRCKNFKTKKSQRTKTVISLAISCMKSFPFPKKMRLLNRKDFVNLNRLGKRYHSAHFTVIFNENGLDISRLGITASKKTGNAVKRNRIKRYIREFYRLDKEQFPQGYDIAVVAKKGADGLIFRKIKKELGEIILDKKFHL